METNRTGNVDEDAGGRVVRTQTTRAQNRFVNGGSARAGGAPAAEQTPQPGAARKGSGLRAGSESL